MSKEFPSERNQDTNSTPENPDVMLGSALDLSKYLEMTGSVTPSSENPKPKESEKPSTSEIANTENSLESFPTRESNQSKEKASSSPDQNSHTENEKTIEKNLVGTDTLDSMELQLSNLLVQNTFEAVIAGKKMKTLEALALVDKVKLYVQDLYDNKSVDVMNALATENDKRQNIKETLAVKDFLEHLPFTDENESLRPIMEKFIDVAEHDPNYFFKSKVGKPDVKIDTIQ